MGQKRTYKQYSKEYKEVRVTKINDGLSPVFDQIN
jgi:hypothetical protein